MAPPLNQTLGLKYSSLQSKVAHRAEGEKEQKLIHESSSAIKNNHKGRRERNKVLLVVMAQVVAVLGALGQLL